MHWIRNIPLHRVEPASPHSHPLQWSSSNQLAINNNNQLTLLDPKLPKINNITGNPVPILETKDIFDISLIITVESQEKMPLRKFLDLIIDTLDEPFTITNSFNELGIASHKWGESLGSSKDPLLGVLFNSGELLIFDRKTKSRYSVSFCIFDMLLSHLGYEIGTPVDVTTYNYLKIKCFSFNQDLLCLINYNKEVMFFRIEDDLFHLQTIKVDANIINHYWSPIVNGTSFLALISSKNEVLMYKIEHQSFNYSSFQLYKPSRFLNHQNRWYQKENELVFISTFTGKVTIFRENNPLAVYNYQNYSTCCGISVSHSAETLFLIISFENGTFESFDFNLESNQFAVNNLSYPLNQFVSRSIKSFEAFESLDAEKEKDFESSASPVESSPFVIEGSFVNYGTTCSNGLITILYKVFKKNKLNYFIDSHNEIYLAVINLNELKLETSLNPFFSTSIGFLSNHWLNQYFEIPTPTDLTDPSNTENLKTYISQVEDYKQKFFNLNVDLRIELGGSLSQSLIINFNENPAVKHLQNSWNFNHIISHLLESVAEIEGVEQIQSQILSEISFIETKIIIHFIKIVLNYILVSNSPVDELDKFIIIRYLHRLRKLEPSFDYVKNVPETATITITTKFFQESFTVNINDSETDNELINSTTNHKWSTCKLTGIPLLKLNSRKDELEKFNYIISEPGFGPLTKEILKSVQYCFITGNKTFNVN